MSAGKVRSRPLRPVQSEREFRTSRMDRIVERVSAIPKGFVRTYGDIDPGAPRLVGLVLARTHGVPWHRVVRADGSLAKGERQRTLLLREGIQMRGARVDLRTARLPSGL
jgi:methylated-DNA-protein-cysteine methyltransferase-like protein